ncbi:MAG: WD40 repeat domain-containing protein [Planctomycetota bacterium]|nr:MAG: WD40 repeat domain-containing protein [Planctomycetota bacterium]
MSGQSPVLFRSFRSLTFRRVKRRQFFLARRAPAWPCACDSDTDEVSKSRPSQAGKLVAAGRSFMFRLHLSWLLVHFLPLFAEHVAGVDLQPATAEQALASQQATGRHDQTNLLPAGALARIQTARPGHEAAVTCVAFAPKGLTLASTSFDEALSLWDPATGKELRRITGHPKLTSAAFSPDGQTVASAGWDGTIRLWQAATGQPFRSLRAQGDRVLAIAFSPDGKLIASGEPDAPLSLWDTATGNRVRGLTCQVSSTFVLAFSPDGKLLASSTFQDRAIQLWEVDTGKPVRRLESPGSFASCFAFSSDGKSLVSGGSNGQLILWEVATAGARLRFSSQRSAIQCLTTSPDGRTIVSGHEDGLVCVWDAATGKECSRLAGHRAAVRSAAFAPAGALLASGSADMTVLIWRAPAALPERRAPARTVSARELAAWWDDLAHDDASRAYRAVLALAAVPEYSVPFLTVLPSGRRPRTS